MTEEKQRQWKWSRIPKAGDGVSRSDPRTWDSAASIQQIVDAKKQRKEEEIETIYQSDFPDHLEKRITFIKKKILEQLDRVVKESLKENRKKSVITKTARECKKEISELFDSVALQCGEWGKIYEELYQCEDELTTNLIGKTQRFLQMCPEYGYPCSPGMEGSVYCVDPYSSKQWLDNIKEIKASREKKANVPKNLTGGKRSRNNKKHQTIQQLDEGTSLVTVATSKREQHCKRVHLASMNHIPDANPNLGRDDGVVDV